MLGLKEDKESSPAQTSKKEVSAGKEKKPAQNDEAKKILAQMEAKKDAGDCPFC